MNSFSTSNVISQANPLSKKDLLQPWLVCLSAAMFFFYEFIQMGMFNSLSPELMQEFNVSATKLGNISATYFYADVTFLFFAGILLDRISPRKVIISALLLCVIATFLFGSSTSIFMLGFSHFLAGIGNAFCFLSCIKLASNWFPPRRMALIIGLTVTLAMAGGVVAQTPLTLLAQSLGWRNAVYIDALLGVAILFLVWWFVFDKPKNSHLNPAGSSSLPIGLKKSVCLALQNPQNWLGGLYTSFLNLPIFLLGDLWGIMYLTQVHHFSRASASYITSMVFVGTIIGSPVVGWFSDYIGRRKSPMIIGAITSLAVILAIIYLPSLNFVSLLLLFLALGFFTSAQIVSYPLITESNPKMLTGTATGLASVLIMGGGAVFQPLFGWFMDLHWQGLVVNGTHVYSATDYFWGMAIMPIAFVIGLIAAGLIKETYGQQFTLHE